MESDVPRDSLGEARDEFGEIVLAASARGKFAANSEEIEFRGLKPRLILYLNVGAEARTYRNSASFSHFMKKIIDAVALSV